MVLRVYIILVTIIALAGVGYFGYDQYQNYQDNKAIEDLGAGAADEVPTDSTEEPAVTE